MFCPICKTSLVNKEYVLKKLFFKPMLCSACKKKLEAELRVSSSFGNAISSIPNYYYLSCYDGLSKELLSNFKFKQNKNAGIIIARYINDFIKTLNIENPILIPAPSSSSGIKKRGFNQMEFIAEHCDFKWASLFDIKLFKREQKRLSKYERFENSQGKFSFDEELFLKIKKQNKNAFFIIIDDVLTTGSTIKAMAEKLPINSTIAITWAIENVNI